MAIKTLSYTFFVAITLVSFNINAYTMRVDRFDVNGVVIDDFDDGAPGSWTNFNGTDTFGTWQDEPGTSFALIESPGLIGPSVLGLSGVVERSDIFSHNVAGGTVVGGSSFNALLTLDTTLPALDQVYYFGLNNFDLTLTDVVVFGISNISAESALLSGLTQGLYFGQFRIDYGTGLVTDVSYASIAMPISLNTIQLAMQYDEIGGVGQFSGSYRFDSNGGFIEPLPGISTNVVNGFWDIGTAQTTVVPVPAAVWLFGSGLIGLIGIARKKKA